MQAGDRVRINPVRPPQPAAVNVWWICGLLLLATVLNYLDRQVLSLTADRIIQEFGLTREQFGEILAWFRYSYAGVQIAGGWLVDL